MKKIIVIFLALFSLLILADGVIHTPWAKRKIVETILLSIQKAGWEVQVSKVHHAFPHVDLEDVSIQTNGLSLSIGSIQGDISLLRLLKKEIFISHLEADRIAWSLENLQSEEQEAPKTSFAFTVKAHNFLLSHVQVAQEMTAEIRGSAVFQEMFGKFGIHVQGNFSQSIYLEDPCKFSIAFERNLDQTWEIDNLVLDHPLFYLTGNGRLDSFGKIQTGKIQLQSSQIALEDPFLMTGKVLAKVDLQKEETGLGMKGVLRIPLLQTPSYAIDNVEGNISCLYADHQLKGAIALEAMKLWSLTSDVFWDGKAADFSAMQMKGPSTSFEGDLRFSSLQEVQGHLFFNLKQLHEFHDDLYGSFSGSLFLEEGKSVLIDGAGENLFIGPCSIQNGSIHSLISNAEVQNCFISTQNLELNSLFLQSLKLFTAKEENTNPFSISLEGFWEHPLQLYLGGVWENTSQDLSIALQTLEGSFFNHPLRLQREAKIHLAPEICQIQDVDLKIHQGSLQFSLERKEEKLKTAFTANLLPIDFLSLNPLHTALEGSLNAEGSFIQNNSHLEGTFSASTSDLTIQLLGEEKKSIAKGSFSGKLGAKVCTLKADLSSQDMPLVLLDISLPLTLKLFPWKETWHYQDLISGRFISSGNLENILEFFDFGSHRIEGNCVADFSLSHTLEHPYIKGACQITNGFYQNYYTGTELYGIEAKIEANKNTLKLTSFKGIDCPKEGSVTATGTIDLLPRKGFPYFFQILLNSFQNATFDLIDTIATGSLEIKGNIEQAEAFGHLDVQQSEIKIPSRIPKTLPNLHVVYKNAKTPIQIPTQQTYSPFPLHLHLSIDAKDSIFISGRGLESEWKGHFLVEGTQTNIATKGEIELLTGRLLFSGREFKITQGSLVFTGKPKEMPLLTLAGEIQVKDVTIIAYLKGPLNNPQISLQSSPPLPMGTIMSYLLFGQDLTEISSFQALQLASSIASLAGEGPGILEQTKKSTGLDRIQIITVPSSSEEGGDTIAIQVGKYVTEGVLVSFSQGAENSSSNISIEIEGKAGTSFLLESDQAQEQGKFTFRLSKTY